ncbi:ATP-binding cassette domain-containing protein, partial [uncultured Duncaniella sp.]
FLFSPADQQKYISTLSGGEMRRLNLAAVLITQPNFLILDEPTNDLDIMTLGILEDYLREFKGCVIVISHDRFFLDSIVDHLFVMEGNGVIKDFPGNYSDYRAYLKEQAKTAQATAKPAAATAPAQAQRRENTRPQKLSFKERKELEALTKEIDELTEEKSALEALFNSGAEIADIADKAKRYSDLKEILDEKELRWLELSEKE